VTPQGWPEFSKRDQILCAIRQWWIDFYQTHLAVTSLRRPAEDNLFSMKKQRVQTRTRILGFLGPECGIGFDQYQC
jgi:hypothetical protein